VPRITDFIVPDGDDYPGTPDWTPSEGSNLWSLIDQGVYTPDDSKFIRADDVDADNILDFTTPNFIGDSVAIRYLIRMRSTDLSASVRCTGRIGDIQVVVPADFSNTQLNTWEFLYSPWLPLVRTAADFLTFDTRLQGFAASDIDISELEVEIDAPGGLITTTSSTTSTTTSSTHSTTSSTASFSTTTTFTTTSSTTTTIVRLLATTREYDCVVDITERNFRA